MLKDRAEVCQSLDSSLRLQCLKYKSILPQDTAPVLPTQPRLTVGKIMNKKEEREQIWLSSVILRNIIEDRVWLLEPREINIMLAWSFACAGEVFRSYPRAACRERAGGAFPSLAECWVQEEALHMLGISLQVGMEHPPLLPSAAL